MADPRVSVVLPTFNRANTLALAIQSVLAQSLRDLELIVVDDASTDATAAVVAAFKDSRVSYLRNDRNLGVSGARNAGVARARAAVVAFQDSDDEWRVEKLAKQVEAFQSQGPGVSLVVCGDLVLNHYPLSYLGIATEEAVVDMKEMIVMRLPGASCWLASKSDLIGVGGFDERLNCFEDWELALRMSERGRVLMVNEPLTLRRKTPNSLFSTESSHGQNLKYIFRRHGHRLQAHPVVWAQYCNMLGQTECQHGRCSGGRKWFLKALSARPMAPRTWVNLAFSFLGAAFFRRYVRVARLLRARFAPSVRPPLYMGKR